MPDPLLSRRQVDIPPDDELRRLMGQTATAQVEIRRRLESMDAADLYRMKRELEEEAADREAESRLLNRAIALKRARGDDD